MVSFSTAGLAFNIDKASIKVNDPSSTKALKSLVSLSMIRGGYELGEISCAVLREQFS